jgi:hypothetical protein
MGISSYKKRLQTERNIMLAAIGIGYGFVTIMMIWIVIIEWGAR